MRRRIHGGAGADDDNTSCRCAAGMQHCYRAAQAKFAFLLPFAAVFL
jgi:hypothetical protein